MPRRASRTVAACGLAFATLGLSMPSRAETIAIACEAIGLPTAGSTAAPDDLTMTYDGDATGTLRVKGPFGEMALPAAKGPGTVAIEDLNDGKPYFGIRAAGPASVIMPDKAAVEACVAGKLTPEEAQDADSAFITVALCTSQAPPTAAPVAVNVSVDIAFVTDQQAGPGAPLLVTIGRTSAEPSTLPGGTFTIESTEKCEVSASQ